MVVGRQGTKKELPQLPIRMQFICVLCNSNGGSIANNSWFGMLVCLIQHCLITNGAR